MANLDLAFEKLLKHEGGYVNDPYDKGGETFCGIARKFNPNWIGWKIIDATKDKSKLMSNKELMDCVKRFYKLNYWLYFILDILSSQRIAEEILEGAVHMGKNAYCLLIKTAINLLNRNQKLYDNAIIQAGWTIENLNLLETAIQKNGEKLVFNLLNFLQARYYINLMLQNEANERWIGWFNRVEIIK